MAFDSMGAQVTIDKLQEVGGGSFTLNHVGGLAISTFLEGFQASPWDEKSRSRSLFFFFLGSRGWSVWPEDRVKDMLLHPRCECPQLSPSLTISPSTPKKLKKMGRKGGPNIQIPKVPQDKVGCFSIFLFLLTNKNAIIINPNKASACCYVLNVVWPGG